MESDILEWQLNRYWYAEFCQKSILNHENAFILEHLFHISILGMNGDNTDSQKLNKIISEIQALQEVVARFRQLRLDATEFACLKCIVTFKAGKLMQTPPLLLPQVCHLAHSATSESTLIIAKRGDGFWGSWHSGVGPVFHGGELPVLLPAIYFQRGAYPSAFPVLLIIVSPVFVSSSYTQRFWAEKFPECCCHRSPSRWGPANPQQLHPYQVTLVCLDHVLKKIASIVNVWAGSNKPVQTLWLIILLPAS